MTEGLDRRTVVAGAVGVTLAASAGAQDAATGATTMWPPAESFTLWPAGRIPNAPRRLPAAVSTVSGDPPRRELHLTGVADPVVGVYRPARPDGRALLAIPGGGYQFISIENEGINVARTFAPLGVTVFVLGYRLPGQGWLEPEDVPLQDGQRAMRLIRAGAARFGVDSAKIGCVGFSAGGLLAASLAVAWMDPVYARVDGADELEAKPAFAGLIYPETSGELMRVGKYPSARFDASHRVDRNTSPVFIVHALDDPVVPAASPIAMMQACREERVPVEAHFFQQGGHGFGPAYLPRALPGSRWPELFDLWMRGITR
ncbi:alpha/beta hydrolase [uncultured Sphingomonas sp.]|uniref:alpha/beta hydrolase n=1 Tax=uncultured Sphingomonas sp. TaxID=158754 RepID=UPI0035CB4369